MKEFIGVSNCPKCNMKKFEVISEEVKDQLTVKGECKACNHKTKGSSIIFRDDTYFDTKDYLVSYFLRSFYLKDNEEIYICPTCDEGFYITRKKQDKGKTAIVGLCENCGFTKTSFRLSGNKPSNREMMNFILNIDKTEIESKKTDKNDFFAY